MERGTSPIEESSLAGGGTEPAEVLGVHGGTEMPEGPGVDAYLLVEL